MQWTMSTVSVLGALLGLLLQWSTVNATPATLSSLSVTAILGTRRPSVCLKPPVCIANSPRVCGRTTDGMCRRFSNICDLLDASVWIHTPRRDCRTVREIGAQHAYWCHQDCPSQPATCPRIVVGGEICVRARNHLTCKVVANRCQLLNNNCFSKPRNNWRQTDKRRCDQMQLGDKPHVCRPVPIKTTLAPTTTRTTTTTTTTTPLPPTTRIVTTEAPKSHESSTTSASSTGRA